MVNWNAELDVKLLLIVLEFAGFQPAGRWAEIAARMGSDFTGEAVRQHVQALRRQTAQLKSNENGEGCTSTMPRTSKPKGSRLKGGAAAISSKKQAGTPSKLKVKAEEYDDGLAAKMEDGSFIKQEKSTMPLPSTPRENSKDVFPSSGLVGQDKHNGVVSHSDSDGSSVENDEYHDSSPAAIPIPTVAACVESPTEMAFTNKRKAAHTTTAATANIPHKRARIV